MVDAEKLAFSQLSRQVPGFTLTLHVVSREKLSANARAAIENDNSIAYLGEITPGSSEETVGITNALDLLQVSPTDNALELTQRTVAVAGAPRRYYESYSTYGHTFARLVPTSGHEAMALLREMQSLGVRSLHVVSDGSDYGRALLAVATSSARSVSISLQASGAADAVLFAGRSAGAATAALNAAVATNPKVKLFVPSALDDPQFASGLSPTAQAALYASSPGFLPSGLPVGARTFVTSFQSAYHRAPTPEAIFGYAAMQAVLHVLQQAGTHANNRGTVVSDFMKLSYPGSVLGPYTIRQGDTSLNSFVIERVKAGRLVPFKALTG